MGISSLHTFYIIRVLANWINVSQRGVHIHCSKRSFGRNLILVLFVASGPQWLLSQKKLRNLISKLLVIFSSPIFSISHIWSLVFALFFNGIGGLCLKWWTFARVLKYSAYLSEFGFRNLGFQVLFNFDLFLFLESYVFNNNWWLTKCSPLFFLP